ncbi:MAG: hypothetical protein EBU90_18480 [Proteobacteria bacterium]|nr:hypothetical protein [Pseudomonadota bacterium]NBP15904.1 hypothetical protein [bacterium]
MKQYLYRVITITVLISSIGLVKAVDSCKSFLPDFISWFNQLNYEQVQEILQKNKMQPNQQLAWKVDTSGLDPVELRAYLLFKKGKLSQDAHQELSELFKDLQDPNFKDDEDIQALRQALGNDLQTVLQKYQADDMRLEEVEDYIENLYNWWNREEGQEDQEDLNDDWDDYWNDDEDDDDEIVQDQKVDPAADALLRVLNSRKPLQNDFPPAPALLEGLSDQ